MKIIYVINNIKQCGPYRVLESLINSMENNEIGIVSLFGNDDNKILNELNEKNVQIYSLNLSKKNFLFKGTKKLKKLLCIIKPDIVHSHGILPDYLLSKIKKVKKISTLHNNMYEDYYYSFGKMKSIFIIKWHKKIYRKFDEVVCCSKSIYDYMIKKSKKINFSYIQNGIDQIVVDNQKEVRNSIRKDLDLSKTDITFIYTGVISDRKRVCELVDMFNELKTNYKLIILGNGPLFNKCCNICKNNKNIIMLGYKENVIPYLIASDVYISNSASEGLSISVLEALMLKKTLFLSDIPSHIECLNILGKYCGDCFNSQNFYNKINKLKYNNNYSSKDLYYISSERMAKKYESKYKSI